MSYIIRTCDSEAPYRYDLVVETDTSSEARLAVIQCNPSTANLEKSDATVGKVSKWAGQNGFRDVVFLNLFAFASTDARNLTNKPYEQIVGPRNDDVLKAHLKARPVVVLAWGGDVRVSAETYKRRILEVKRLLEESGARAHHVGALSRGRYPRHGRMWNTVNRKLQLLDWTPVLAG